ncbi:MAG: DUF3253 domain-containing protein [Pseudomonadota bacterium]
MAADRSTKQSATGAATVAATILALCERRGPAKSVCPSEVARALSDEWRMLMPMVREIAADLAARGEILVTQKGQAVDAQSARGPIRLSVPGDKHESG